MKRKHFIIISVSVLLAVLLWPKPPQNTPSASVQTTLPSAENAVPEDLKKFEREREEKRRDLVGAIGKLKRGQGTNYQFDKGACGNGVRKRG